MKKAELRVLSLHRGLNDFSEPFERELENRKVPFILEKLEKLDKVYDARVLVTSIFREEWFELLPFLELVEIPYAGLDHLDLSIFEKHPGVMLANTHANASAVAEHAILMMLALARKLLPWHSELARNRWHSFITLERLIELRGSSLGIAGYGRIGRELARLASSFGMRVSAIKARPSMESSDEGNRVNRTVSAGEKVNLHFLGSPGDFEFLVRHSDFIVLALPLTPQTRHLVNLGNLELFKGKFLINVARGELIEEEALYEGLARGIFRGAGIDTWYSYPGKGSDTAPPSRYDLSVFDNIIMSPHSAGYTEKAFQESLIEVARNIAHLYHGEPLENLVDLRTGY